jgi:transposase
MSRIQRHDEMLQLSEAQLDWICKQIPDAARSAKGGRPVADKRKMVQGIFWILDNGAKWKDLPAEFGPKSTVHDWFHRWAEAGVFERIMRKAGRCVERGGGFKLYECFVDASFSKARQGGDGIGVTRVGKGVKIMLLVDAKGLPIAAYTTQAGPHESHAVQGLFDFMVTKQTPPRIIGDKAYDSDRLDAALAAQDIEMIAPHRSNRKTLTQDGRPLRRYQRRWTVERSIGWLQNFRRLCIRWEKSTCLFQGFLHLSCSLLLLKEVFG